MHSLPPIEAPGEPCIYDDGRPINTAAALHSLHHHIHTAADRAQQLALVWATIEPTPEMAPYLRRFEEELRTLADVIRYPDQREEYGRSYANDHAHVNEIRSGIAGLATTIRCRGTSPAEQVTIEGQVLLRQRYLLGTSDWFIRTEDAVWYVTRGGQYASTLTVRVKAASEWLAGTSRYLPRTDDLDQQLDDLLVRTRDLVHVLGTARRPLPALDARPPAE